MDYSRLNKEQLEAVTTNDGPVMVLAGAGSGKALVNGTGVLTRGGYLPIEKLHVGASVFGSDGNTHKVLGVYPQGRKKVNIIKFFDGTEIKCCKDHLWTVIDSNDNTYTFKTSELKKKIIDEKYYVPTPAPFQLPEQPISVDPYTLGLILATIKFTKNGVRLIIKTDELLQILTDKLNLLGFSIKHIDKTIYKVETDNKISFDDFIAPFKVNGVKRIPKCYKINNVTVRRNLLIGFIDAIGINHGSFYTINTTKELMDDLKFIAQTIGFLASAKSSNIVKNIDGVQKVKEINKITIYPNRKFINKLHTIVSKTLVGEFEVQKKYITQIKELETSEKMTCIQIDSKDKLFVTKDATLTHNTTVLVNKVAHLIENGVSPERILMLTFTNKAAQEMTERIKDILDVSDVPIWGGTYHSFCAEVLRRNAKEIGFKANFAICDTPDSAEIINLIKERIGYKKEDELPTGKTIVSIFSYCTNKSKDIAYALENKFTQYIGKEEELEKIHKEYVLYKYYNNILDYDDLLVQTNILLTEYPEISKKISNYYQYILVDEYQDSNKLQLEFLLALRQYSNKNICVVGDPEQCVVAGTKVKTPSGYKPVEQLTLEDKVLAASGRGGLIYSNITKINTKKIDTDIVTITTETGRQLATTTDHIYFVDTITHNKFFVYLLENIDGKYEVGVYNTNIKAYESAYRIVCDKKNGKKLWVLGTYNTSVEAVSKKEHFEKTLLIESEAKNIIRDAMLDNHIYYEYPTYVKSFNDGSVFKVNYTLFGDTWIGSKRKFYKSLLVADSLNKEAVNTLADVLNASVCNRHQSGQCDRFIVKKIGTPSEIEIPFKGLASAKELNKYNPIFVEDAFITQNKTSFVPASMISPGMKVCIFNGKSIEIEEVVKVDKKYTEDITIYDIDVDKLHNYFANNICIHNCIYGFRGSRYENILEFPEHFEDCKVIKLNQNYRSNQEILDLSNEITTGSGMFENKLIGQTHIGYKPKIVQVQSTNEEANFIIRKIKQYLAKGYKPSDIAVLARGSNDSTVLETRLTGIVDYNKYGGIRFWERESTKNILSFLKVLNNHQDEISWFRILKLYPNIGSVNAKKITEGIINNGIDELLDSKYSKKNFYEFLVELHEEYEKILDMDLTEKITYLVNDYYQKIKKRSINARKIKDTAKRQELANLYEDIERLQSLIDLSNGYRSLNSYINDLLLDTSTSNDKDNAITISTIHSAKGLEWKVVFILSCIEGKFPSDKGLCAHTQEAIKEHNEELAEEQRVFYVAITRCKEDLYLMYPEFNFFTHTENELSSYLTDNSIYKTKCETIKVGY